MPKFRSPSGRPAWPLILVEGPPKSGSSVCAYSLSRSPKVGRSFVIDLRDDVADEYAALGPYELVEPDNGRWTYGEIEAAVRMATTQPRVDPDKPNLVVLDKGTYLWDGITDHARSRAEKSKAGQRLLADDPDAEVNIGHSLWNDAAARWTRIIRMLQEFPGIGIVVCEGEEVTKFGADGKPTTEKTWSVKAHKSLPAVVDAWVRLTNPGHRCHVIGVRSLTFEGREMADAGKQTRTAGFLELSNRDWREDNPLEELVFDIIAAGREFEVRRPATTETAEVMPVRDAQQRFADGLRRVLSYMGDTERRALARRGWDELLVPLLGEDDTLDVDQVDSAVSVTASWAYAAPEGEAPVRGADEIEVGDPDPGAEPIDTVEAEHQAKLDDARRRLAEGREELSKALRDLSKTDRAAFAAYAKSMGWPARGADFTLEQLPLALAWVRPDDRVPA